MAEAYVQDTATLVGAHLEVRVVMQQPGFVRAIVSRGSEATKVEWAHDSAWRFLPAVAHPVLGYVLHPTDLAVNKVLALVGRREARDFLDVLEVHRTVLPLGALCWAATGKDPGFTPLSLLELLRRRGRYHPEDFARLRLVEPVDLPAMKAVWLEALDDADAFMRARPPSELGCLYYSRAEDRFVQPLEGTSSEDAVPHYGRPGGVLPVIVDPGVADITG